jgi:hypothetical protein
MFTKPFLLTSVADPTCHFDADPTCHVDADPDRSFHFAANPDPDPSFQIKARNLEKVFKEAHIPYILAFYLQTMLIRSHLIILIHIPFYFSILCGSGSAALFLLLEATLFLFYFSESSPLILIFFTFLFPFMLDPKHCKNTITSRQCCGSGVGSETFCRIRSRIRKKSFRIRIRAALTRNEFEAKHL